MFLLLAGRAADAREAAAQLLKRGLAMELGLTAVPPVARGAMGKPYFPLLPQVHFNLSHSGTLALCAISDEPVGVDIEEVRPRRSSLPRYVFCDREYRWYLEQGGDWRAFWTLWTRKESWVKRTGGSVAHPRGICPPLPGETVCGAFLRSAEGEDWQAAVCTGRDEKTDILWLDLSDSVYNTIS